MLSSGNDLESIIIGFADYKPEEIGSLYLTLNNLAIRQTKHYNSY